MSLAADIALAHRLADAAGAAIRPWFRKGAAVEAKDDLTPVTFADRAAETAMREILDRDRPADGILGEEHGAKRPAGRRIWVLDPIDGTRAFIAGRPIFGTLIALLEDGIPILGVIDQPIAGDRWVGRLDADMGTTLNGRPVRVRDCARLAEARAATTSPAAFSAQGHAAFQRIGGQVADMLFGGDCHNYGLLAAGHLDLVIEEGLQPWDWAALVPIVKGAGGRMTDWEGRPLLLGASGAVVATGDPRLHEAVLARL
jgi:inositol-phosphate phosphatase/L-galactose 1-phosphate phosphatase/histidinol-phosphatase